MRIAKLWNKLSLTMQVHRPIVHQIHSVEGFSILAKAVLDNEVIEVIASSELEQVLPCSLPERQVDLVGIE